MASPAVSDRRSGAGLHFGMRECLAAFHVTRRRRSACESASARTLRIRAT